MKLTDADLDKLRTKQVANIIRKLGAGKTISAHEQKLLDEERDRTEASASELNFVRNWDDLAQALDVSRKSIQNWRTREDLRSAKDFPRPRADGRHDVNAWRAFMIAHRLKRADEDVEPDDVDGDGERKTIRDWKEHREELMCAKLEREIARGDSLLLVATELEGPIGATLVAIQTKLSQFPPRVARFMVMLRDEASAEEKLRDEMDAVLADLSLANYIDGAAENVAREFPFNDECADLYARVSFAGQDRSLFVELIQRCVTEALRRVGARALSDQPTSSVPQHIPPSEAAPSETSGSGTAHDSAKRADKSTAKSASSGSAATKKPRRKRRTVTKRRKA